jgi:hypothetical protein
MLNWSSCSAVERDPCKVSGARVDDFLAWFPGVSREQAEAVLEHAQLSLQIETQ